MQEALKGKLHQYIKENNPDLLLALEEERGTNAYLKEKVEALSSLISDLQNSNTPEYIIEETCMNVLTKDLRPSKYNYILNILEEEFEYAFYIMQQSGTVVYEISNIINQSEEVFKAFEFSEENEDNRELRYAITGTISKYLSR